MTTVVALPTETFDVAAIPVRSNTRVIKALTGVRAVAAVWVVLGHFAHVTNALFPGFRVLEPLISSCYLGVDLFFVLSGFILTHNYLDGFDRVTPGKYGRFLWARLARMYPVHLFMLLVLVLGIAVGNLLDLQINEPNRLQWGDFVHQLLLTHSWGMGRADSWNGPAWSISAEWFAYLLFPFMAIVLTHIRNPRLAWVGVICMYVTLFSFLGKVEPSFAPAWGHERPLVRVITEFGVGCLIYRVYQSGWGARFRWSWIAAGCVVALLAYVFTFPPQDDMSILPSPILALLILALAQSETGISAMLATPLFMFWGEVSYALYMTHFVVRMVLQKVLPVQHFAASHWTVRLNVVALHIALIALTAVGTYLLVEKPSRNWMRRMVSTRG